ncbi:Stk1 family PASTA domain-containing Ser/Thr kinase [Cellulomonas sp. P24]|uniref:Stk1 family PASTA domain-containing Ser/Thr kinase n=1 Tax=Cellulomonas sp. P24 TaxID=2885206 RepID=UPI00216AB401|nr:Stk1 family PASTA domain-containing Ser/Thr kinase [Cellulomonas sp. P24]MCR6494225.1 Stk1 family PASTA domain-containing Ser/Thr kinase [Cellulomonas sp. P24]
MGTTVTDPLVGKLVDGRYEVVSRIARGGMATVYLAIDRRLDRDVALKVMHGHLAEGAAGAAFISRFRREARSAARLTHPGLVAVYDQGIDGETSYLTMEYIDGGNLRRRLADDGPLVVEDALRILEDVLDALAAAHRSQLVHRDIKPENVLLATDGRVKVADFGLARAVTEVTSTTTGTVLGTVAYLAPELVAQGISDARTDVYATGILLFELLTGRQPFTGETPIQVAFQHVNSQVPGPSTMVPWLPAEIDDLVTSLAARAPDDRPTDAGAALALVRRTRLGLDPATLARRAEWTAPPARVETDNDPDDEELARALSTPRSVEIPVDPDATTVIELDPHGSTVALPIGAAFLEAAGLPSGYEHAPPRRHRLRLLLGALAAIMAVAAVALYMLVGPGAYTSVPDVVGQQKDAAFAALRSDGLQPTENDVFDDATAGTVVTTSPSPHGRVHKGGEVVVAVSKGPDLVTVPDGLVGSMQADAKAALEKAGLKDAYAPGKHYSDTATIGSVLATDQKPGTELKRGSTVTLTLADGPEPLTIFSVVGASQQQAESDLTNAGLKMAVGTPAYSDVFAAGAVMSQDPAPGTAGHRTDTVTVVISLGPEMVVVPDVTGQKADKAQAELEALGLKVVRQDYWPGLTGSRVLKQSIPPKTSVPKNSTTITLTLV